MKNRLLPLVAFLFAASPALTQVREVIWFHKLGKEDGILHTSIRQIFQDSEGFTWLGAESGLDRYDGHSLVHFLPDASDKRSLSGNQVYGKFFEDREKNIWFCNDGAIQCYRRRDGYFSTYYVKDARGLDITSGYQAICLERDSLLWLRAEDRTIFYFDIHRRQPSAPVARTRFDIDIFPGIAANGRLRYLFSVDGAKSPGMEVFELNESRKILRSFNIFDGERPDHPPLNVHRIHFEHDTVVWLSANSGLYLWNLLAGTAKSFPTGNSRTKYVAPLDSSRFIVTERNVGLSIFDKKSKTFQPVKCRLLDDPRRDIDHLLREPYIDPHGNIWISVDEEGVIFSNPGKVKFRSLPKYPSLDGSTNYTFRTMLQRADQRIWCSTFRDGIFFLDADGTLLRQYHPDHPPAGGLESRLINHMLLDRGQRLWVATEKGVSWFDDVSGQFIPVTDEKGEKIPYVTYMCQLKNGDILVSSLQHGIFSISPTEKQWRLRPMYSSTGKDDFFTTIYEDSLGSIYISRRSTEIMIFNISDGKLKPLITKEIKGFINGFLEDADGKTLWIATSSGLASLDKTNLNKKHHLFINRDDLQNNDIQSLGWGAGNTIWMGTTGGLARFHPRDSQFVNFSLADGAQSRQFDGLAVLRHRDGSLWFGGNNGITIVETGGISSLTNRPNIQITGVFVNDAILPGLSDERTGFTNVNAIRTLDRKFRENTLSFSFVAIDYSDPAAVQLEYMMEGFDKNWVRLKKGEPGFARYPRLPPRTYLFKVRAANSDGLWSAEEKVLSIRIRPHWTQTWWARSGFAILLLLGLYAAYRYRISQIRKTEAFKRKEAEYKQLVAETETAVLRLQMNPHFIFNSMNSISSYILKKDIDTANDYLSQFARLMRMILKFAEQPYLEISQELELLKLYLNTEAMRFEDCIEFEFVLDEGLAPDEVVIPTMILQPFVENAIWHGLAGKKGHKKITVGFAPNGSHLLCSVEDNGIGRAAAQHAKAGSLIHESKAIDITRRRLRILEEMEGVATELKYIDLEDENGRPAGTRVTILLPLLR